MAVPKLLRRRTIVTLVGVSSRTVDRMVRAGVLPVVRVGRGRCLFRREDVERIFRISL